MLDKFTVEEINLICCIDAGSRKTLIGELASGLRGIDEPDMIEIFVSAIKKLETITDAEFSEIGFYSANEYDGEV